MAHLQNTSVIDGKDKTTSPKEKSGMQMSIQDTQDAPETKEPAHIELI